MFSPVYFPKGYREQLEALQKRLSTATPIEKEILEEKIAELNSRQKTLENCTHQECLELKTELMQKITRAKGINADHLITPLASYIRQVDLRMQEIYYGQLKTKYQEEEKKRVTNALKDIIGTASDIIKRTLKDKDDDGSEGKTKDDGVRNPWSIKID